MAIVFMAVAMLLSFFVGCTNHKPVGDAITERDSMPVMRTTDVDTYLTDSGITKRRIETPEWLVYDRKKPSYWAFEKGIYVEEFDTLLNITSTIKADTLYYYDKQKLWKAIGNVEIKRSDLQVFSELIYWDEAKERLYSDKRVHVISPTKDAWLTDFWSDQDLKEIHGSNPSGEFEFNMANDTTQVNQ